MSRAPGAPSAPQSVVVRARHVRLYRTRRNGYERRKGSKPNLVAENLSPRLSRFWEMDGLHAPSWTTSESAPRW